MDILLCPGARVTLATHVGLPNHPSSYLEFTQNPQFCFIPAASVQKPCVRLPQISAFSGFFSLFGEERECVCVSFSPRDIQCVLHLFPLTFLSPSTHAPPCALTVNVEPGSTDATTLVSSFLLAKRVPKRIGHGNIGTD